MNTHWLNCSFDNKSNSAGLLGVLVWLAHQKWSLQINLKPTELPLASRVVVDHALILKRDQRGEKKQLGITTWNDKFKKKWAFHKSSRLLQLWLQILFNVELSQFSLYAPSHMAKITDFTVCSCATCCPSHYKSTITLQQTIKIFVT